MSPETSTLEQDLPTPVVGDEPTAGGAAQAAGVRRRPRRARWLALALAAALVVAGGVRFWPDGKRDIRDGTTLVDQDGLAARYGIRVTLIALSADGGIIDFRYQVVDPDKATPVIHDNDVLPILIAEPTGETIGMMAPAHHHSIDIELGGAYFFLMANANNAVKAGTPLTLVMGDVRLEHIITQA